MDACQDHPQAGPACGITGLRGEARQGFSISLVLPAYNEQQTIVQAVCEADDALSRLTTDYEILVVDDGSTDATAELVSKAAAERTAVRLVRQPRNMGYGAALRRGFTEARCQLVGFTDSDCQFHVRELDRLLMLMPECDIACGYRIERQDPLRRCFYSKVYNLLVQALFGTGVRDVDCALKLFHRDTLKELAITTDGYLVNTEMLTQARQQGRSVIEVGVTHRPRAAGESKVSVFHVFPVLLAMIRFWWNFVMFPQQASLRAGEPAWPLKLQLAAVAGLGLVSAAIWFSNLGYPLIEPDETRYAQIAIEMYESGDWIVPRLQGEPYLDKPPLLYWATAASYTLFGVSQQSARLPNTLSMFAAVLAVYVLGRRLVGDRAAAIGSAATMLCAGVAVSARFLLMDSMLTLFTTLGLLCAGIALRANRSQWLWWLLVGVACGLGTMTKGPVAMVICIPPMVVSAWLQGDRLMKHWRRWLLVLMPGVLLAAPWFYAVIQRQPNFVAYFFWEHNVMRYVNGLNHEQPWWFYLPVVAIGMFPSSLFLPAFLVYLFRRRGSLRDCRTIELGFVTFAGVWVLAFFSASTCKLPTYVLPAVPMLCLGIGKMLADTVWSPQPTLFFKRYADRMALVATVVLLLACVAAGIADFLFGESGAMGHVLAAAFVSLPIILLIGLFMARNRQVRPSWAVATAVALIAGGYGFDCVVPQFAGWRSISRIAAETYEELGEGMPIVYFCRSRDAATMNLKASQIVYFERDELEEFQRFVERQPLAVVVTNRSNLDLIQQESKGRITLEPSGDSDHVYVSRGRAALTANRPAPAALH